MRIETIAVHGGQRPESVTGAITPSIVQAKNGAWPDLDHPPDITYARSTPTPTRKTLGRLVAELEGGGEAFTFASGMAAISCLFHTLDAGDHVILGNHLYGWTLGLVELVLSKFLDFDLVDPNNTEQLNAAVRENTKYLFIETPTNPLLEIVDLEAVRDFSASNAIPYVLDNTFATPYLLQGFEYGAETIIHSTSKYLGGHNDLVGGVLVTRNDELAEKLGVYAKPLGATPGPHDVYSTIRGIKTLALRMDRSCENAQRVVEFLQGHDRILKIYYPGLPSHPGHEIAKREMEKFGGMVSFEVDGDYKAFASAIAEQDPPVIYLAESLGGTESLLTHPATMSHKYLSQEQRIDFGINDNLFRLSVGIEHHEDIIHSLETALESARTSR